MSKIQIISDKNSKSQKIKLTTIKLINQKKLKKNNISEEKAFELVFREFWILRAKQPSGRNWQTTFKNTFGMTLDEFYEKLSKYKTKDLKKILPSKTLKIQDIFN